MESYRNQELLHSGTIFFRKKIARNIIKKKTNIKHYFSEKTIKGN